MIKKLLSHVGEYKKATLLTPLFVTLEVILDIFIPLLMAMIVDRGINGRSQKDILWIGAALIASAILALIFGMLSARYAATASAGFAKNLRQQVFENIQKFSFSNIDRFSTPSLVTRLTTDVTNVQNAFQMTIRILVRSPLLFIFSLVMAFRLNSELAMVFLIVIPFLAIGLFLIIKFAHPAFKHVFRIYDRLNQVVQENLQGIRIVKSYVKEEHEVKKFSDVSQDIYKAFSKAERIVALNQPVMQIAIYTALLLISWIGANLIVVGSMTTGELMSMFMYVMQILVALNMMSMVFVILIISRPSAERMIEVLDEKSDLTDPLDPTETIPDGSISFENVDFSYTNDPDKLVLKNLSFTVQSGQTVGIIGGTGSGKTSLIQLIPRLYDATNGNIRVGGRNVKDYSLHALRDAVAVVLQKNVLFSGTIKENLRWGNEHATDEEIIAASRLAQADSFVQGFPDGYDTYIEQGGSNVSGGQKQRLTIARALLKNPKILILDDSTSAVDTKTDALIQAAFYETIPNTTKIIIAQRITSVEKADLVIVMDEGQINGIGTPAELLANNQIYQEVYQSQQKGFGTANEAE
ncbi:ABC transporter ATP-binding protein [Enterococcus eurekensis]|uniref:ABC transporter ATP-binding protein n=2 Tax=Enterococcus TaxID=1350 RepID=A0ABV9M4I4_9ENTE|nr:ABC transporter ATP-binding protein/permease [Candidatus Enterococcus avicola]